MHGDIQIHTHRTSTSSLLAECCFPTPGRAPVCNASRVATLTGLRPGITGIYDNARWHEIFPGLNSIPQHFKAQGYRVVGGGKVYHHMPGFNRLTDWDEYFPQVFDGHYQHQLHSGLSVKDFRFPEGYPLNNLPSVKALNKPPKNPRELTGDQSKKRIQKRVMGR